MRNNIIVTSVIGEKYEAIWKITGPTIEAYTDRINADMIVLSKNPHPTTPHWVKFALHGILHKMYKRAAWIDADIIIRRDAPDIFEIVPEDKLGVFNEGRFSPRAVALFEAKRVYKVDLPDWDKVSYFNTGVMVVSQDQRSLFNDPEGILKQKYSFGEQTFLNLRIQQRKIKVKELSHHFNRMSILDSLTGVSRLASYFVHYAGYGGEDILGIIQDDLDRWEECKTVNYIIAPDRERETFDYSKFNRPTLFLNIGGGLGDQVCAEPVVRYIREKLYPDADIYAISTYPELFSHISDIKVSKEVPTEEVDAVYRMDLHPDQTKAHHQNMIYNLSHPVDYISLTTLKRILPAKDKQIKLPMHKQGELPYNPNAQREVGKVWSICPDIYDGNLILVHPGTGWESKTFPVEWWQAVIDGLTTADFKVGIIGRDLQKAGITHGAEHSYLGVKCPQSGIDFRDKLSTLGLMALIRDSPILISNESAPIHIAGAFDNWIILIPTNKNPEHVLPYRHGSTWYKAAALYKNAAFEDYQFRPSNVEAESIARLKRPIEYYLPDPREVIDAVNNIMGGIRDKDIDLSLMNPTKGMNHEYCTV
jgi:ADP-heptose:LPS heptosyltransferase